MDSQSFDYWMSQNSYVPIPSQHAALYNAPSDRSSMPSLSSSPESSTYDPFPAQMQQTYYPQFIEEPAYFGSHHMPMTPPELGSDHDSPLCSPRLVPQAESIYMTSPASLPTEKSQATSGRRRAQNRAAQRAFRERKEKHARDLEGQLAALTEKYNKLETSHNELGAAYGQLRKTIELLTRDDQTNVNGEDDMMARNKSTGADTVRKLLDILHGGITAGSPQI